MMAMESALNAIKCLSHDLGAALNFKSTSLLAMTVYTLQSAHHDQMFHTSFPIHDAFFNSAYLCSGVNFLIDTSSGDT